MGKYFSEYNNDNNERIITIFPLLTRLLWKTSSLFNGRRHFIPLCLSEACSSSEEWFCFGWIISFQWVPVSWKVWQVPSSNRSPWCCCEKWGQYATHTARLVTHLPPSPTTNTKKMKEIKCQPVIFKVLTCERNCACNYEQAEVLAYKQEKLTASWVFGPVFWLAVCLAVALAFILMSCLHAFFGYSTSGGEASPFPHILLACDKQSAQENVLCTTVVTWVVSCHFWQKAGPNVCECNILWESVRAREGRKAGRGCNFSTTMTAVV